MGGADYINVLYSEFLNFDPDDAEWVTGIGFSWTRVICHRCFMQR